MRTTQKLKETLCGCGDPLEPGLRGACLACRDDNRITSERAAGRGNLERRIAHLEEQLSRAWERLHEFDGESGRLSEQAMYVRQQRQDEADAKADRDERA